MSRIVDRATQFRGISATAAILTVFYLILIVAFSPSDLVGDEERYLMGAKNLANGFLVDKEHPDFTNGPGYPLLIMPLVAMDAPLIAIRGLNAVFLAGALWFFYGTAKRFVSPRWALGATIILGLNPVQLRYVAHAKTEAVALFFACGFAWAFTELMARNKLDWRWVIRSAAFLFALAMVRVLFGYVAMACLLALPAFFFLFQQQQQLTKALAPFALSLCFCLPWLFYTYSHTGKFPCWSTNGGELLYWITSPYENELGTWFSIDDLPNHPQAFKNHIAACASIEALPYAQRDAGWVKLAKKNFQQAPEATVRNLVANFSRIFLGFPGSYRSERITTVFWIIPSGIVLLALAGSIVPAVLAWRQIPLSIKSLGICAAIFFGGSVLLPAEPRYLLPIVPFVLLWLAYVYANVVQLRINLSSPAES